MHKTTLGNVRSYQNTHQSEKFTWAKAIVFRRIHVQNLKQKVKPIIDEKESGCVRWTCIWNGICPIQTNPDETRFNKTHTRKNAFCFCVWCWIRPFLRIFPFENEFFIIFGMTQLAEVQTTFQNMQIDLMLENLKVSRLKMLECKLGSNLIGC